MLSSSHPSGEGRAGPVAVNGPTSARFGRAAIATPHHLATSVGEKVLREGGAAVDAAVAANLVLGVVTPYRCGFGGDVVALVHDGTTAEGYLGVGRAPRAATIAEVRRRTGRSRAMPFTGPLTVTVPGAVRGWFDLLERYGQRGFADLAEPAVRLASEGFTLSPRDAAVVGAYGGRPRDPGLDRTWWPAEAGRRIVQPGLARLITLLGEDGPGAFYKGEVARDMAAHLLRAGGLVDEADLAEHAGAWVQPLHLDIDGRRHLHLPPPTQGVTGLQALGIATPMLRGIENAADRAHLMVEACRSALRAREKLDPNRGAEAVAGALSSERLARHRAAIRLEHASSGVPLRSAPPGTVCIMAADAQGSMVAVLQSNYSGFGSGLFVDRWGLALHNRGVGFSLDPGHPRALRPHGYPLHTLVPTLVLDADGPLLACGVSGGDAQTQSLLQVLTAVLGEHHSPRAALARPRWWFDPARGELHVEDTVSVEMQASLASRGHNVVVEPTGGVLFGSGTLVMRTAPGFVAASDPRTESAVGGL